jgi:hypothetical protein
MRELYRWQNIKKLSPPIKKVIPLTDFSENQSNPCVYYYWQLPKVLCTLINNVGAIKVTTYYNTNLTKSPSQKKWSPLQIFLKINPIHAFTIIDNFPKFHVYQSTNFYVDAIQSTTYHNTNSTKSPSHKSDTLDRFFWKSIPSTHLLLLTTS